MLEVQHSDSFSKSSYIQFLSALEKVFGGRKEDNRDFVRFENSIGQINVKSYFLEDDICMYMFDCQTNISLDFQRKPTKNALFYDFVLLFKGENNSNTKRSRFVSGDLQLIFYRSSNSSLAIEIAEGIRYECLVISISRRFLLDHLAGTGESVLYEKVKSNELLLGHVMYDAEIIRYLELETHMDRLDHLRMLFLKGFLYEMLSLLIQRVELNMRNTQDEDAHTPDIVKILEVAKLITADFSRPCPNLNDMAQSVSMSPTKFKMLFKKMLYMPYYQYYQHYRLLAAKKMLQEGKIPSTVATSISFNSVGHFNKAFKDKFGMYPKDLIGE